jgi:antibiotic biosynthesis monooxygenase (ABM) superfamily enzyme
MENSHKDPSYGPVDFIVHLVVEPHLGDAVQTAQADFMQAASGFPGHIQSIIRQLPCEQAGKITFGAIHSFDTANHLVRWLESDERKALMTAFDATFRDSFQVDYPNELGGFTAWFPQSQASQPSESSLLKWKMNLIVLATLYPLTLGLVHIIPRWIPGASKPTVQLVTATIAVMAMGFWLVPLMGKLLNRWLRAEGVAAHIIGCLCLVAFLYAVWHLAHWSPLQQAAQ